MNNTINNIDDIIEDKEQTATKSLKPCTQCFLDKPIKEFMNDKGRELKHCARCREIRNNWRAKRMENLNKRLEQVK
jgi:hypothetical protein